ncbi:glycoside hydrolase family 92 protein [Pedobacter sp. BS3]|uniref:GH92 family glycosyl hydrolase n=1 Tax=Pedobacter sp. BS3 TaxID=2567937 RepID=UPI0011EC391E|nr:GH92 family glycosyl hydrolase [Pedobacter sp. BS3]TZF83238.1 glycoside hydrolase family 92 protein [Pedobacter sp. BS3]
MTILKRLFGLVLWCSIVFLEKSFAQTAHSNAYDPVEYVNPLMGTASKPSLSNGNTYPAIALPWGMNFWTPQTGKMGNGWIYTYDADKIRGFKQTHQPSPWMKDYGQFSLMPVTGKLKINEDERASWFSHKSEIVRPYYYCVYLADYDVTTEIAPTERAACFRFTFPQTDSAYMVIDAFDSGSYIKIIPEQQTIIGYTTKNSGGVPDNFRNYFIIRFDKKFAFNTVWSDGKTVDKKLELEGNHVGAIIGFKTSPGEKIQAQVASSFISHSQARINLNEIGSDSFETIKQKARASWNKELSRIHVEGGTTDQFRTFYSCLYRSLLFPRKFYEIDANGKIVHYSPYNGKTEAGYMFTDTGFWDTFRALFPFLNLMYPSLNAKIQEGLVNAYKEGGWLPEWASPGLRNIMIGSNSASIVAEAWLKGCRGYDINTLYEALLKNAEHEGPLTAVGRKGAAYYNQLGYVPCDVGIKESAARTLEYAYDDFAIYQLAKALKRPQAEINRFAERCRNYRNLFDPSTGLMRGKKEDGTFQSPFNPFKWGDSFTEGNSWHYTWSVFHDVQGLINLMGGKTQFIARLDSVFSLPPVFDESYYKSVIHEIREMQIANMGQYAHGNQPIQHMIYLYNYAGAPWKAQYWIRETMNRMYLPTPDGYCGDEDNGQTSAWYVFSAMGFYPVCPALGQYVMGAPLFKKMILSLENGKQVVINAALNGPENRYVRSVTCNGQPHTKTWFSHQQLMQGAVINFTMSPVPYKNRRLLPADLPFSLSLEVSDPVK